MNANSTEDTPIIARPGSPPLSVVDVLCIVLPALAIWAVLAWLTTITAPRAAALFAEFRLRTPMVTEFVVTVGWWALPALLLLSAIVTLVAQTRWGTFAGFVIIPGIGATVVFCSIYVPAAQLIDGLRGVKPDLWNIFWI